MDLEEESRIGSRRGVLISVPSYPVYDGIVRSLGLSATYVSGELERGFLPEPERIEELVRGNAGLLAIVLTYPSNPTQHTYEVEHLPALRRLVSLCQERGVFIIFDAIYQDTIWNPGLTFIEPFTLSESARYLVKLFGASKDRAQFAGYRAGYFVGDERLARGFLRHAGLLLNTHNSLTKALFGLDLFFRRKRIERTPMESTDLLALSYYLQGWARHLDLLAFEGGLRQNRVFERYCEAVSDGERLQSEAVTRLKAELGQWECFDAVLNEDIGNLIFIRVSKRYYQHDSRLFCRDCLRESGIGVMPGHVFGTDLVASATDEAWFRMTTIHSSWRNIAEQVRRIAGMLLSKSTGRSA